MQKLSFIFAVSIFAAPAFADQPATDKASDIFSANRKLGRGMNLGNTLEAPNEGDWGVSLKAEYFQAIKNAGFDTVRVPVNWANHAKADSPYTIDPTFAKRVDWAIDQALANHLNIIVNVHHYRAMETDPDKHLPRLVGLWEQIGERYKDKPAKVYFELLNEPTGKLTDVKWNETVPPILKAVRKSNPTRPVIIGPASWNAISALEKLELPQDDKNLIVTVHSYDPFQFTHQGASWVKGSDKWKGKKWTGTEAEKAAIQKQFDKASAWSKKHTRPIFLGEFGAYEAADMESRARWTRFVVAEAEGRSFSWAYWEFCSGFGAYDAKTNAWRKPLLAALVETPGAKE